jgi:glucose-1-phosphate cytidylyltransferase
MKAVILAGGRGTRIAEESHLRPKPMIEIGGRPLLWHIMRIYAHHGVNEFVICLGYRGYMIKEYFANYFLHESDVTFDLADDTRTYHDSRSQPWKVTLADTGEATMTGGRIKRIRRFLDPDEPFLLTYGDGVADVDVEAQIAFHREQGAAATMTVVRPPARFGDARVDGGRITGFAEKPQASSGYINGGFFVLEPSVIDLIDGDDTVWEREPLEGLSTRGELAAWHHDGFWQAMDTLREREVLEHHWSSGAAPWKVWS